jgi:hypothetical protein
MFLSKPKLTLGLIPFLRLSLVRIIGPGSYFGLFCSGESWFRIPSGGIIRIEFNHAQGDLDLIGYDANRIRIAISQGTGNSEQVTIPQNGYAQVIGYRGATNHYSLIVQAP